LIHDKDILRHIARQPRGQANYKQLMREMGIKGPDRRLLDERLKQMKHRGEVVEIGRDRYALPEKAAEKNLVAGRLNMHRDGYGFVIPDSDELKRKIDGDIYIPPPAIGNAMHGDRVLVELSNGQRAEGRVEGRIVRVSQRAQPTVVGVFHYGDRHNVVKPFDDKLAMEIIIAHGDELPRGPEEQAPDELAQLYGEKDLPRRRANKKIQKQRGDTPHRVIGEEARVTTEFEDLEGVVVNVEIMQYPTHSQPARGRVVEVLGYEDDFGVDVEIIIRKHHLPHVFPPDVLAQAQSIPATIPRNEIARRRDHRELPIVTIDGETARDFDDAVLVERLEGGNYRLHVHIADVAQYVTEGSALDREARMRGTSVYFPDRAVPMLPLELSTDICSLRPNVERLVLSCVMEIDHQGEVVSYDVHEGVIRSAARMTYTNVQLILDGDAGLRKQYEQLVPNFELMRELAEVLNRKRVRRGSIDFDLPEPIIEFDEQGMMVGVQRSERKFANRLIEEFMLSANECVAEYLEGRGIASLYRIHEKPDPKKLFDFETLAASFGYSLGIGSLPIKRFVPRGEKRHRHGSGSHAQAIEIPEEVHITPRMYQKLTQKIAGTPEERILSYLMLRSLKQARYSEINEGHFALAAETYTHFTSPIRRYPDLIVHRILKEVLHSGADDKSPERNARLESPHQEARQRAAAPWAQKKVGDDRHAGRRRSKHQRQVAEQHREELPGPIPEHVLHDIAEESSIAERRADDAERELMEWKKLKFMRDRVGEDFDALIVSVTKFGFFVELKDLFIEGLVPLQSLTDDHYTYRENTRQIIGERWGRKFSIGDGVRVILDRIDRLQRKLQFAVEPEPLKRTEKRPKSGKKNKKKEPRKR